MDGSAIALPGSAPVAFTSRDPGALHGALWVDPATLATPAGAARALKAVADFEAYMAGIKAFLVNLIGEQIAEEPLEGRDGQPTRLSGEVAHAATVSEVALLTNTSEAVAARTVNFSRELVDRHPAAHEALLAGDTTEAHVRVVVEQALTLPDEAAETFGVEALSRLHTRKGHPRTPGELRTVVKALRERMHPESITRRKARAAADRGVWLQPEDDGMCTLTALLPAEIGHAAYQRIDVIAQAAHRRDGEYRTKPQLRADALAQALVGGEGIVGGEALRDAEGPEAAASCAEAEPCEAKPSLPAPVPAPVPVPENIADLVRAEIVVHIPAAVLLGRSDDVAELEGYGAIDASTARELAAAAPTWQRIWDDEDCVPVKLGRTAYRPPEGLRRFIRYRDGVCLVPGCTCAARRAEVDHIIEWQDGGCTDADNLALLCAKHHALKSLALFMLRRAAGDGAGPLSGELVWTTLLGFEHPAEPLERDHILGPRSRDLGPPNLPATAAKQASTSVLVPPPAQQAGQPPPF